MALDTIISSSWPQEAAGAAGQFGSLFGGIYDYTEDDDDDTFGGGLLDISTSTTTRSTNNNNKSTYHHQVSHESSSVFVNYYSSSYNSPSSRSMMQLNKQLHHWDPKSSPPPEEFIVGGGEQVESAAAGVTGRRKRIRRKKSSSGGKNKEELENQRMTHIEVERNRRKQMNQYLAVIRSLMPSSYVQRGDQASIVGGAINFVKQLEQQLQTLELQKSTKYSQPHPFAHFFAFPQYSCHPTSDIGAMNGSTTTMATERRVHPAMAEIEVTLVESQGNIKVLSKKRHSQLLKLVAGLQYNLWLTVLHLNVTTIHDQMVLYTLSVKLEDRCQLSTVDEIADAVNSLLCKIEEESLCSI